MVWPYTWTHLALCSLGRGQPGSDGQGFRAFEQDTACRVVESHVSSVHTRQVKPHGDKILDLVHYSTTVRCVAASVVLLGVEAQQLRPRAKQYLPCI